MVDVGPLTPASRRVAVPNELTDDGLAWLQWHAALAGTDLEPDRPGLPPADTSWLRTEKIRG
jgi:hypothetical protein